MNKKAYQPRELKSFAYAKRAGKKECLRRGIAAFSVYRLWANILVIGTDEHVKWFDYVKEHEIPIGPNDCYTVYVWRALQKDEGNLTQRAPDLPKAEPESNDDEVFPPWESHEYYR